MDEIRTRPIISSCDGPADKLSWFLTKILSPLLVYVDAHLRNTKQFRESLALCDFSNAPNLHYQSFDVVSLYTNVDSNLAVDACLTLLHEHEKEIRLYGLTLSEIRKLLTVVLKQNIFRFNNIVYRQIRGLAMGSRIAPLLAIIFLDSIEKRALRRGIIYYKRYIDDIFIVARSRCSLRKTLQNLNSANDNITFTVEDPGEDNFLPFLNTKVRIRSGKVESIWYKEPASANVLVHSRSCHPYCMKNMRIAQETTTHDSTTTIRRAEDILRENGYRYEPSYCWKPHHSLHGAVMVMPYVDERLANRINCAVRNSKIPARLIFRPPRSLKELLTSSRQYESVCVREHCSICTETQICGLKNTVYEVKCMACFETYIGETSRPLFERIDEHRRALTQPASYTRNAFSRHRTLRHTMERPPKLDVSVLHRNMRDPLERKIREALEIRRRTPAINSKEEMAAAMQLISISG
ncbi:hypothetical protein Y032_0026g1425 [Ancylostoma ceylanicum]|uniref:Reverse transcriptase domain-containing protein n=1 Tax=Ancylostoma ceylanicum TaxID=53326 RepID=A0A016UVR2_9BILA|nr:hypothetical protein Y032_0026g1425 [Ancylostoma ceylanicum]